MNNFYVGVVENKYFKIYMNLVNSRISRGLNKKIYDFYTEKHHIIPKCLGGRDLKENYVLLTAREHYLAHWLLTKCSVGIYKFKLACAFYRITNQTKGTTSGRNYSSRQYERARILHSVEKSKAYTTGKKPKIPKYPGKTPEEIELIRRTNISKTHKKIKHSENSIANLQHIGLPKGTIGRINATQTLKLKYGRKLQIDDICFISMTDATDYLGITASAIKYRCESSKQKWQGYKFI